jgi:hypothetical protein
MVNLQQVEYPERNNHGKRIVDHAFKVYANRWKFKHPTRRLLELWKMLRQ